jgi:transposase
VIWCGRVKTRGWIGCGTGTDCRSSVCATGGHCRPTRGRSCGACGSASSASRSPPSSRTFDSYLRTVDLVDARIQALERAIRETAELQPWRALVAWLRCLRGIDTLTALALVTEIADFDPFNTAEEFMAFVGLVPSERSSGQQRRQGSITKVGNSHVRRLLVESAWHARRRPTVGYQLARRQRGQDAVVVERAWRCQQRHYQRWQRMAGRGKPRQKIVVACARELAGFVGAIATEQPLRNT